MKTISNNRNSAGFEGRLLVVLGAALLCACSGGGSSGNSSNTAEISTATTTVALDVAALPAETATQLVQPLFHIAPVLLDEPPDVDTATSSAVSGAAGPRTQPIPLAGAVLSTNRLSVEALSSSTDNPAMGEQGAPLEGVVTPMASGGVVSTYTPAQIRAAYSLPVLPVAGSSLTADQAAQLGSGQTIYIVDAMHDPNAAAELTAFNQKFGLPACKAMTIAANASLPLAAASTSGCEFSVVYSTPSGAMTSSAPAYDSGWATEIALDLQWAHATVPMARLVLIEAPDASLNSLLGAIKLANSMGPGIVSMSFGAVEGSWTASVDSAFGAANMTYLAATGDSGASVQWPAVSPKVLAVGGTSLTYTGTGPRSEISWSGTGGGTSLYTATPSYQTNSVPGMGTLSHRAVADVAFNADPSTGQYVAVISPGSSTVKWLSAGGTSLSTPQWAGLIAIANASRALAAKPMLGAPHAVLYNQISTVPTSYTSAFADITNGSDGSCMTCKAKAGYDQLSGLGTPNFSNLLAMLSGAEAPAVAPKVTSATVSGKVGTALSFTISVTAANPVTYALSGAPAGMSVNSSGGVTWAEPIAGTYAVTATATDSKTGLSGQGVYTINIAPALVGPVVSSATISGQAKVALSYTVSVSAPNPVTYTLSGAPSGMKISKLGVVSWAKPVAGSYSVTVVAKDTKTKLIGQGVLSIKIGTPGPVITASAMAGVANKPLTGTITISDPGAVSLSISISGAPMGMMFSANGTTLTVYWARPVPGNYSLKVSVVDSARLSAQASVPLTITAQ